MREPTPQVNAFLAVVRNIASAGHVVDTRCTERARGSSCNTSCGHLSLATYLAVDMFDRSAMPPCLVRDSRDLGRMELWRRTPAWNTRAPGLYIGLAPVATLEVIEWPLAIIIGRGHEID